VNGCLPMKTASWANSMKKRALVCAVLCLLFPFAAQAVTISLVGDCTIGSIRYSRGSTRFLNQIAEKGFHYPFMRFAHLFLADDLTIANCEGTFTSINTPANKNKVNLYAPPEWAEVFALGGVDAVNTENNHTFDFGRQGHQDTLASLDTFGIAHFGGGELAIMDAGGIKVGLTGYTYPHRTNIDRQVADIAILREAGCDLIVVSMHWGREEKLQTTPEQRKLGPQLIDAGADIVYGHGPHVLQPIEIYNGKPIFYSLANFTFGANANPKDPDTACVRLEYEKEGEEVKLKSLVVIPARMHDNKDFRPYPYSLEKDIARVLKKLDMTSPAIVFE